MSPELHGANRKQAPSYSLFPAASFKLPIKIIAHNDNGALPIDAKIIVVRVDAVGATD